MSMTSASVARDLKYAARIFSRSYVSTGVILLTLGLAIGVNTAIFSLAYGILSFNLPFPEANRLAGFSDILSKAAFQIVRANSRTMDAAAYSDGDLNLTTSSHVKRLKVSSVSANFFSVLRVSPAVGRVFVTGEDAPDRDNLAILGYRLWQKEFNSDPGVIGRTIQLGGLQRQVVGVMPASFAFPSDDVQMWIPLDMNSVDVGDYWGNSYMPVFCRLRPGTGLGGATSELHALIARVRSECPWEMPGDWKAGIGVVSLRQALLGGVPVKVYILIAAAGIVLLLACANVANLELARAMKRHKEMALREAIGADRSQIVSQVLTESCLLAFGGGLLGLFLAWVSYSLFISLLPAGTPGIASLRLSGAAIAVSAGLALLVALGFGIFPALGLARVNVADLLRSSVPAPDTPTTRVLRDMLVIAQICISVVLITAAASLSRSEWNLLHHDLSFDQERIVTTRIAPDPDFCFEEHRCELFYANLLRRVSSLPGVTAVAASNGLPLETGMPPIPVTAAGTVLAPGQPPPFVWERIVTPGYLKLMNIPLLQGRNFTPRDLDDNAPPVVLVTQSTAHKMWPGRNPVGLTLSPVWAPSDQRTVVGVVPDLRDFDDAGQDVPGAIKGEMYVPYGPHALHGNGAEGPMAEMTVIMHVAGSQQDLLAEISGIVRSLNGSVPMPDQLRTMRGVVANAFATARSTANLFVGFALLALVLGTSGLYGLTAYLVSQRTRELGIRLAIGASSGQVVRLLLQRGVRLSAVGLGAGFLFSFALLRFMKSLLYQVGASDPAIFWGVGVLLGAILFLACYLPARRASAIEINHVLREN